MMTQGGKVKKFQISAVKDINAIVPGWGIDVDHYHVYKICHVKKSGPIAPLEADA